MNTAGGRAPLRVAVVGGGWAGLATAVGLVQAGCSVSLVEARRQWGGRARTLPQPSRLPNGQTVWLDNGQHILIGAYTATLGLMRQLGLPSHTLLHRQTLDLRDARGHGLWLPDWPAPWDVLAGVLGARGWPWADRSALLARAARWRLGGFACAPSASVAELCAGLPQRVVDDLIAPLCVSALNTAPAQASGSVFLRVLQDALLGARGGSRLLIPRVDLGALLPQACARWLHAQGAHLHLGVRCTGLDWSAAGWRLRLAQARTDAADLHPASGTNWDAVVLSGETSNRAATLVQSAQAAPDSIASQLHAWVREAQALTHTAIATVYAWGDGAHLPRPMLALHSSAIAPAQFAFDRGQLGGPSGLLAWVVSDAQGDAASLQAAVLAQARAQLGLALTPVRTLVERRATWACTPGLQRPRSAIAPGLWACGDAIDGPYPATLEGAVRSAASVVDAITGCAWPLSLAA